MTLKEFMKAYRKAIVSTGAKKTSIPWGPYSLIRFLKGDQCYCPITLVVYSETGVKFEPNDALVAARTIGLPFTLAFDITQASDFRNRQLHIRRALLKGAES
jgi:hypothetical protein